MPQAKGTFEVTLTPQTDSSPITRFDLLKTFHGDLEGSSIGEMLSAGSPPTGNAGYVALEVVTGSMHGRTGNFALQHNGVMDDGSSRLTITIVPGSSTDALEGLRGTLEIERRDGVHHYTLDYELG
jgi:hypothetical protein